jgi:hypothetical protein
VNETESLMLGPVFDAQGDSVNSTTSFDSALFTFYSDTGKLVVHQDALLNAGNASFEKNLTASVTVADPHGTESTCILYFVVPSKLQQTFENKTSNSSGEYNAS